MPTSDASIGDPPLTTPGVGVALGTQWEVEVGRVAHGGHCVARHEGRVIFVRHALPGERVIVEITGVGPQGRFLRADAVSVLVASSDRVEPPCPYAHPGGCGGCDWQHASLSAQRRLKSDVVVEQLRRLGGLTDVDIADLAVDGQDGVAVRAVPGDTDGLLWRTRVRYAVDEAGRVGFRRQGSHDVQPVETCRIAHPAITGTDVTRRHWPGVETVGVVVSAGGDRVVLPQPTPALADALAGLPDDVAVPGRRGRGWVREVAAGREWRVAGDGFWQVHPGAADALVAAVLDLLRPRPGEHALDLYAGVGLFGGALADRLGPGGRVDAVEADARAVTDARRSLHGMATVHLHHDRVDRWLRSSAPRRCDLVVLDPPRAGAGPAVLRRIARLGPRALAYVACDPASLGRDVGFLRSIGWRLAGLRALDIFPMTAHVECVALLRPPANPAANPGLTRTPRHVS